MNRGLLLMVVLALTACEYKEVEREVGYKGKARANPWLALERFAARDGHQLRSVISWTAPEWSDATWLMPASVLANETYTRKVEKWVEDGGHLILLVEHAESESNDWFPSRMEPDLRPPLFRLLKSAGITLEKSGTASVTSVEFEGDDYEVKADSTATVAVTGGNPGVFASLESGSGRITVITDARILRNRWIGDCEHADLLRALLDSSDVDGALGVMRGSGLSLAGLIREYLGELLIALAVWLVLWLWKGFARFGPTEPATQPQVLRGYEHHLEALGDYHWRMDKASSLLAPLRGQVIELGQRASARAGRRDEDFFQYLADLAGIPRERVFRALAEQNPADAPILTRTTADLQQLLGILNPNSNR